MRTNKILERNLYSFKTREGKTKYFLILGFHRDNVYNRIRNGFRNHIISPKVYEDKKKVLLNFFDTILKSDSYIYYGYTFSNKEEILNISFSDDEIGTYRYNDIRNYLKKCVKRIDKKEFQKWVLKSTMLGTYQKKIEFHTKEELIEDYIKNNYFPKSEDYINSYMSLRYIDGSRSITSGSIVIRKCYKTNQVWYIKGASIDKKTILGYKLKTFKKSELLDMLDFVDNIATRNRSLVKHLVLKNSLELKNFDFVSNKDKIMMFKEY